MTQRTEQSDQAPRVLVVIPSAGSDGQGRLSGIFHYLGENRYWDLVLPSVHVEPTQAQFDEILSGGMDGVIIATPFSPVLTRSIIRARIPVVALHDSWMHRGKISQQIHFIFNDHVRIGRLAARYFISLGHFAAHAFLRDTENNRWGRGRMLGFERELAQHGIECRVFTPRHSVLRMLDRPRFDTWLKAQPKPLALFAANDRMAVQAIGACHDLGLRVPSDVAILGVNNDETLVSSCEPRLSSIAPDFHAVGYAAAEMLDDLMRGRKTPRLRLFANTRLVERASTAPLKPSVKLVEDALAVIAAQPPEAPLTPTAVARKLRVSRPLLDLRFRELKKGTLAAAIRSRKLEEVARLLRETDYTIRRIGSSCGFENERSLKNVFRRTFGMTMSAYRSEHARTPCLLDAID